MAIVKAKWYDDELYMKNKLAQMQLTHPEYTQEQVYADFDKAGFTGEEGHFRHFLKYGNSRGENISPNKYFNAEEYYRYKAQDYYQVKELDDVTQAQVTAMKDAIHKAGMSAWTHYIRYGTAEGINASSKFDTKAYMQDKLRAMQEADIRDSDGNVYTMETLNAAFRKAGLNALEHAIQYGRSTGDYVQGEVVFWEDTAHTKPNSHYTLVTDSLPDPDEIDDVVKPADPKGHFWLSTDKDTIQSTSHQDGIVSHNKYEVPKENQQTHETTYVTEMTYNKGDAILDPSTEDRDELELRVDSSKALTLDEVTVKNVESIHAVLGNFDVRIPCGSFENVQMIRINHGAGKTELTDISKETGVQIEYSEGDINLYWKGTEGNTKINFRGIQDGNDGPANVYVGNESGDMQNLTFDVGDLSYLTLNQNLSSLTITGCGETYIDLLKSNANLTISTEGNTDPTTIVLPEKQSTITFTGSDDTSDVLVSHGTMTANDIINQSGGPDFLVVKNTNDATNAFLASHAVQAVIKGNASDFACFTVHENKFGIDADENNIYLNSSLWSKTSDKSFAFKHDNVSMELTTYLDVKSEIYQDEGVYMLGDEKVWKQLEEEEEEEPINDDLEDDTDVDIVGTEDADDDVAA